MKRDFLWAFIEWGYLDDETLLLIGVHSPQTLNPALCWKPSALLQKIGAPQQYSPISIDHGAF